MSQPKCNSCMNLVTKAEIKKGDAFVIEIDGVETFVHRTCANEALEEMGSRTRADSLDELNSFFKKSLSEIKKQPNIPPIVKRLLRIGAAVKKIYGKTNPFFGKKRRKDQPCKN